MFKEGEKYKCKRSNDKPRIIEGEYYTIDSKIGNLCFVMDHKGEYSIFALSEKSVFSSVLNFQEYFYKKSEERKLKLKKLNDVK